MHSGVDLSIPLNFTFKVTKIEIHFLKSIIECRVDAKQKKHSSFLYIGLNGTMWAIMWKLRFSSVVCTTIEIDSSMKTRS